MSQKLRLLVAIGCVFAVCAREISETHTKDTCCNHGTQHAIENSSSCSNIPYDYYEIPAKFHHVCQTSMTDCCNERRSLVCKDGLNDAKDGYNCNHRKGMWHNCCTACKHGIDQAKNGGNCEKHSYYEKHSAEAFLKCCLEEQNSGLLSSKEESVLEEAPQNQFNLNDGEEYEDNSSVEYDDDPLDAPDDHKIIHKNYSSPRIDVTSTRHHALPLRFDPKIQTTFYKPHSISTYTAFTPTNYDELRKLYPDHNIIIEKNSNNIFEILVECKSHDCEHRCIIKNGKQVCICPEDFVLASDDKSCCRSIYDERRSPKEQTVRPPKKTCPRGQFLNDLENCENINECSIAHNACGDDMMCVNNMDWFYCVPKNVCKKGFIYDEEKKKCEDVNECLHERSHNCRCDEDCVNTIGSFRCIAKCQSKDPLCPEDHLPDTTIRTTRTTRFTIPPRHSPRTPRSSEEEEVTIRNVPSCESSSGSEECPPTNECESTSDCQSGFICETHNETRICVEKHCDSGFELIDNSCQDIDECTTNSHECPPNLDCFNLKGTYRCDPKTCEAGFKVDSRGNCTDINECLQINDCKNSKCVNTYGDYECECYEGYKKDPYDERNCVDIDECEDKDLCEHKCLNTHGSFYCICDPGYELNYDKRTCRDIDECETNPCNKKFDCINFPGYYECKPKTCQSGYIVNDDGECDDYDECLQINICLNGECVNTNGSYRCDCNEGFDEQDNVCVDINECEDNTHSCDHECRNTIGSYVCSCRHGYKLGIDNLTCDDINECESNPCKASEICKNVEGSYNCVPKTCQQGYQLDDNYECVDIDECKVLDSPCIHATCFNYEGGYRCDCHRGLTMNSDGQCVDDDECSENSNRCQQDCHNTFGSYYCSCKRGYRLNSDGRTCADIDECQEGLRKCRRNQYCQNYAGGSRCVDHCQKTRRIKCQPPPLNITLTTTTTTTTVTPCYIPPINWRFCRDQCQTDFDCAPNERCKKRENGNQCKKLVCRRGSRINLSKHRCEDINECTEGLHNCHEDEICINQKPHFRCLPGFKESNVPPCTVVYPATTTTTANPCLVTRTTSSTTTWRPRVVICPPGYRRDKRGICEAINSDPCDKNPCLKDEICSVRNGTYFCSKTECARGLILKNGKCVDLDECKQDPSPCSGECVNTFGSYICRCDKGFKRNGTECSDINECKLDPKICGESDCFNTPGGHKCHQQKCDDDYEYYKGLKLCKLKTEKRCWKSDPDCDPTKPNLISEIFHVIVSNLTEEKVLLTVRMNLKYEVEFNAALFAPEEEGVKAGDKSDFDIKLHPESFDLIAIKPLFGPQNIQVDLMINAFNEKGGLYYRRIQKVHIYVSKYGGFSYEDGKK